MNQDYLNDQIEKLKEQIKVLQTRKKSQIDEIDSKIYRLQGQILNYQKLSANKGT